MFYKTKRTQEIVPGTDKLHVIVDFMYQHLETYHLRIVAM